MATSVFIVVTDRDNPNHNNGLHENTAPYLLTLEPGPGDTIFAVIPCERGEDREGKYAVLRPSQAAIKGKVREQGEWVLRVFSHPGRSATLGEDGLEDAYGRDVLDELYLEALNGSGWTYAPVYVEAVDFEKTLREERSRDAHVFARRPSGEWVKAPHLAAATAISSSA